MKLRVLYLSFFLVFEPTLFSVQNAVTTEPTNQGIVQRPSVQVYSSNSAGTSHITPSWNWTQSIKQDLSATGDHKIELSPCPAGLNTLNNVRKPFYVYIPTGTPEAALVTGGECPSEAKTGNIIVATRVPHSGSFNTIQSAYAGIQEALNECGSPGCGLIISPTGANENALTVYATIYVQNSKSSLKGEGKPTLLCKTRSVCMFLGDHVDSNDFHDLELSGIRFAAGNTFDGIQVTRTECSSNVSVISLNNTGGNAVRAGDYVDINWTFNRHYWGVHLVASASATEFTYADKKCGGSGTIVGQASAGFASVEDAAIEDNMASASLKDLYFDDSGSFRPWGRWQNFMVVDNDQALTLDTVNHNSGPHCTANYCGNAIYFPGPFRVNATVGWLTHLNLSLNCSGNGITNWAGNTLHITDSVVQGFSQWAVMSGSLRGGYGGTQIDNLYVEASQSCLNPMYGLIAAQAGFVNNGQRAEIRGGEGPQGWLPTFAKSGNQRGVYHYWLVVHDTAFNGTSRPLPIGEALVDNQDPQGTITGQYPRVSGTGTVTYDVLRTSGNGLSLLAPFVGGCPGGSAAACGSVIVAHPQCSTVLCSFTDTADINTNAYTLTPQNYTPGLFWLPGGVVSLANSDEKMPLRNAIFADDNVGFTVQRGVASYFSEEIRVPQFFFRRCGSEEASEYASCLAGNSSGANALPNALLLQSGYAFGAAAGNFKGLINTGFALTAAAMRGEVWTIVDNGFAKTLATPGNRPPADPGDTYIGLDFNRGGPSMAQLAFGAPVAESHYIGSLPDDQSYKERLTSTNKTFTVPVGTGLIATSALAAGVPVKADRAHPNQVVMTTTTDTGPGIVIGVVSNSPGPGGQASVAFGGVIAMTLGTGSCVIGNFVVVDTTTAGRVKCTPTFTAGTVIGTAIAEQHSIGATLNILVGLR